MRRVAVPSLSWTVSYHSPRRFFPTAQTYPFWNLGLGMSADYTVPALPVKRSKKSRRCRPSRGASESYGAAVLRHLRLSYPGN